MDALTESEIKILRSIAKAFTNDEWRALKTLAGAIVSAKTGGGGETAPQHDELSDSFLDNQPWTDRDITKNPRRWAGVSLVGYRYSEAPTEWLNIQASAMEFKAMKGREEPTPRLNNKGKPWHEVDAFEAKICRAWARRNAGKALPPPKANVASETPNGEAVNDYEEEFVP